MIYSLAIFGFAVGLTGAAAYDQIKQAYELDSRYRAALGGMWLGAFFFLLCGGLAVSL